MTSIYIWRDAVDQKIAQPLVFLTLVGTCLKSWIFCQFDLCANTQFRKRVISDYLPLYAYFSCTQRIKLAYQLLFFILSFILPTHKRRKHSISYDRFIEGNLHVQKLDIIWGKTQWFYLIDLCLIMWPTGGDAYCAAYLK